MPERKSHRKRIKKKSSSTKKKSRGSCMTIPTFLKRNPMSKDTLYKLWNTNRGPRSFYLGRARRISYRAEADWIEAMEALSSTAPAVPVLELDDPADASGEDSDAETSLERRARRLKKRLHRRVKMKKHRRNR